MPYNLARSSARLPRGIATPPDTSKLLVSSFPAPVAGLVTGWVRSLLLLADAPVLC